MRIKSKLIKRVVSFNQELAVVFGEGTMNCVCLNGEIQLSIPVDHYNRFKQSLPAAFCEFFGFFEGDDNQQTLTMLANQANFEQLYHVLTRVAYHLRKPQGILAYNIATEEIKKIRQAKGEAQSLNNGFDDCLNLMRDVMAAVTAYQHNEDYLPSGSTRLIRGVALKNHIRESLAKISATNETLPKTKHMGRLAMALSVFGSVMMLGAGVMILTGVLAAPGFSLMAVGAGIVVGGVTLFQKRARVTRLSSAVNDFCRRYDALSS